MPALAIAAPTSSPRLAAALLRLGPLAVEEVAGPAAEAGDAALHRPASTALPDRLSGGARPEPRRDNADGPSPNDTASADPEDLLDAFRREAVAIRARLADGAWHARFRSAEYGPIAVRIAPGRDGVLVVTVRAPDRALAHLDADELSATLRRPLRLLREPAGRATPFND